MATSITLFGWLHTVIGVVAVVAGFASIARHGEIALRWREGAAFFWLTVITCITGFFIFRHGGFSPAHALGILTLVVLAFAWFAEGVAGRHGDRGIFAVAAMLAYTFALFLHFIPAFNETLTRVPAGSPIASGPEDPILLALVGGTFLCFSVLGTLQVVRRLRRGRISPLTPPPATS